MKKRTRNRMAVFALAASLLLSACSKEEEANPASEQPIGPNTNFNATGLPVVHTPIKLKIPVYRQHYQKDYNEMVTLLQLKKKTNIDVQWEQIPAVGWKEKKNLMLASGDFPDAFFTGLNMQDVVNYGSQGILIPLEGLIEQYAPNIKKVLDQNPTLRKMATAPDGHIYSVPWFEDQQFFQYRNTYLINKKWLDKLGLGIPRTTDELYRALKAFKENDPNGNGKADEIPATFRHNTTTNGYYELYGAFGLIDALTGFSVDAGKRVVFEPVLPAYKEAVQYLHKLYREGLFDRETFTQDVKQLLSKTRNDPPVVGLIGSFNGVYELGFDLLKDYAPIPALIGPHGDQIWRRQDNRIILNYFSITNKNKCPEATMRYVDTMNDPLTVLEFKYGPFGSHLLEKAGGTIEIVDPPRGQDTSSWIGSTSPSTSIPLLATKEWLQKLEQSESDKYRSTFYELYKPYIAPEERVYPTLYMSEEENKRLSVLETDVMTYVRKMEAKWIVEGGIEGEWDKYVQDLKKMGLDELLQIKQNGYDRFVKG
ncbi:extracellular solute-binding protein [Paenibacillus hemerocallicola]|uniref:Extracellular solute-binding protein n=1 Tax=Paenibacillus hemerocallicola TaxID=1172614 RepID=A0A5C4SV65_9BACL|nr:extracellular solute-binding protein [Paenibacillus hemerocallicola]TNJ53653.1 extracellular solute-binding protein [Paenibacillus hemerocallicola]